MFGLGAGRGPGVPTAAEASEWCPLTPLWIRGNVSLELLVKWRRMGMRWETLLRQSTRCSALWIIPMGTYLAKLCLKNIINICNVWLLTLDSAHVWQAGTHAGWTAGGLSPVKMGQSQCYWPFFKSGNRGDDEYFLSRGGGQTIYGSEVKLDCKITTSPSYSHPLNSASVKNECRLPKVSFVSFGMYIAFWLNIYRLCFHLRRWLIFGKINSVEGISFFRCQGTTRLQLKKRSHSVGLLSIHPDFPDCVTPLLSFFHSSSTLLSFFHSSFLISLFFLFFFLS